MLAMSFALVKLAKHLQSFTCVTKVKDCTISPVHARECTSDWWSPKNLSCVKHYYYYYPFRLLAITKTMNIMYLQNTKWIGTSYVWERMYKMCTGYTYLFKEGNLFVTFNIKQNDYPIHSFPQNMITHKYHKEWHGWKPSQIWMSTTNPHNLMMISYAYITCFCTSYKMTNFFHTLFEIYIHTFRLSFILTKSSMKSPPQHPPLHKMVQQLKPWSNNIQWLLDPHNSFNNTNNTSKLFLKCPNTWGIDGNISSNISSNIPFSHPQCANYVDPFTPMCIYGHTYYSHVNI
jgi:hypothetical protein